MQYGIIPHVNKPVSRIFFGTAMPPILYGQDGSKWFEAALESGINAFDTARNYAYSEKSLGDWIRNRGCRDDLVILSKCGHPSDFGRKRVNPTDMRKDLEESLRLLGVEYIDIYLLHRDDPEVPVGELVETFNTMHNDGLIGAFGASNWTHSRIQQANDYAKQHQLIPFVASSPNFGLADQIADPWGGGCVTISGPSNANAREWYRQTKMPIIAYSSLGRGFFSSRVKSNSPESAAQNLDSVAYKGYVCPENFERLRRCEQISRMKGTTVTAVATKWIFSRGLNVFAVMSASDTAHLADNVAALDLELSEREADYLDLVRDTL